MGFADRHPSAPDLFSLRSAQVMKVFGHPRDRRLASGFCRERQMLPLSNTLENVMMTGLNDLYRHVVVVFLNTAKSTLLNFIIISLIA